MHLNDELPFLHREQDSARFKQFLNKITKTYYTLFFLKFYVFTLDRLSTTSISFSHFLRRAWELASAHAHFQGLVCYWTKVKCIIYFRNMLDLTNHLRLIVAFYDHLFGFYIVLLFFTQNLMTSKYVYFSHMQYQPSHEWFLHVRKIIRGILNNF